MTIGSSSSLTLSMSATTTSMDTVTATSQAIELENGNRYEGPLKNGLPNGRGKLTYSENDPRKSYEGNFVNGELEGTGLMTWRNGQTYEGQFHNNNIEGAGTMRIKKDNGVIEIRSGNFRDGKLDGNGKIQLKQHDQVTKSEEGLFENNQLKDGTITVETRLVNLKKIKSGTFKDGKLHGNGKIQLNDDGQITLKEGSFENNQLKKGKITTIYKEHQKKEIREGNFENGELNGVGKITIIQYEETIELRIGTFKNSKLHGKGTEKIIKNSVTFLSDGEWKNGVLWNGKKEFQNQTINYVNGEIDNPCCVML